jgi:hypothetical protein
MHEKGDDNWTLQKWDCFLLMRSQCFNPPSFYRDRCCKNAELVFESQTTKHLFYVCACENISQVYTSQKIILRKYVNTNLFYTQKLVLNM